MQIVNKTHFLRHFFQISLVSSWPKAFKSLKIEGQLCFCPQTLDSFNSHSMLVVGALAVIPVLARAPMHSVIMTVNSCDFTVAFKGQNRGFKLPLTLRVKGRYLGMLGKILQTQVSSSTKRNWQGKSALL